MHTLKRILFLWLFLWPLWGPGNPALHAEEIAQEYQLKLAFLINFARFITWPESSFTATQGELTVCVVGQNPFGDELRKIENRKIGERRVRIKLTETAATIDQCHLLFVSSAASRHMPQLLEAIKQRPVVTVSDIPNFVDQGGGIELVLKQEHLAFIINNSRLKDVDIQAASPMLNLALEVR